MIDKLWGREYVLVNDIYCGKILQLKGGYSSSTHCHKIKQETFYCVEGEFTLTHLGEDIKVKKGDEPITIRPGEYHSFKSKYPAEILEISTKHDDNDVYRREDSHKLMTYCFDIDGVICSDENGEYGKVEPNLHIIEKINELWDEENRIIINTARGSTTKIDWRELTEKQLSSWGVKYDELIMGKPCADLYIDDRCVNIEDWA